MFQENLFKGKTVFVTGGGSGIGKAIAKQFLQLRAKVYIASRKKERLEGALNELQQIGDCDFFELDIRNTEAIQSVINTIKSRNENIDILINNGGGQFPSAAENISEKGWNAVINTNLNGTFFMTQAFAQAFFMPNKNGTAVNIIAQIFRGFPGMAHTGAARAGVDNLTKTLAVEWVPYNFRINSVAPSIILSSGLDQYPPEFLKDIDAGIPMRRMGTVDEVAYLVVFLASPMAEYITGQTVYVDGGQSLWGSMWQIPDFRNH
jgi:citronellol/citronellal dehydrogenase